jgi:hypothetical protein
MKWHVVHDQLSHEADAVIARKQRAIWHWQDDLEVLKTSILVDCR